MKNFIFTNTNIDNDIVGVITFINYECTLGSSLSDFSIPIKSSGGKKILIDSLLKTGPSKYRFSEYIISNNGYVDLASGRTVSPDNRIISFANDLVRKYTPENKYGMFIHQVRRFLYQYCF